MRTRAYRPEALACLETRSLLSGAAGLAPDPVVLPDNKLHLVAAHVRLGFEFFARDRVDSDLREEIHNVVVVIPFGKVDGLGVSINNIVDRMEQQVAAHVPYSVRVGLHEALAAMIADVQARIRSGDVIVR